MTGAHFWGQVFATVGAIWLTWLALNGHVDLQAVRVAMEVRPPRWTRFWAGVAAILAAALIVVVVIAL